MSYKCGNCDKPAYKTMNGLTKHLKTCFPTPIQNNSNQSTTTPTQQPSSTMDLMSQFMKKMEDLENENNRLRQQVSISEQNQQQEDEIKKSLPTELPYDKDQLMKAIYKNNPYTQQFAIRRDGFVSKDVRAWYVVKHLNILDYPESKTDFYKNCLKNVLDNIPTNKLPYRVKDFNRHLFYAFDYTEQRWVQASTTEFINLIIKKFLALIHASLLSGINVLNDLTIAEYNTFQKRRIDPMIFRQHKQNIQVELTYKFSLPEHDGDDEKEILNFYKRNFTKIFVDRFKPENEPDEEIEEEDSEPIITLPVRKQLQTMKFDDSSDSGYSTETDLKKMNPYYDDGTEDYS